MKKLVFIGFVLFSLSGCGGDPLTRAQCREVMTKSAQLFATYNPRNTEFVADLNKKTKMSDEEFEKEMGTELDQCQKNWDTSHYQCVFETTTLMNLSKCDLDIN